MGNYIDYDDLKAYRDVDNLERTTDEQSQGISNQTIVNNIIGKSESVFEGYAVRQYDLVALRVAKPEQAQSWITDICLYELDKRRPGVPADVKEKYLETKQELKDFARTGIPELISDPTVTGSTTKLFLSSMETTDMDVTPDLIESVTSWAQEIK